MAKYQKPKYGCYPRGEAPGAKTPAKLIDRNKQMFGSAELQLPPTEQAPIRQRTRMAGGG